MFDQPHACVSAHNEWDPLEEVLVGDVFDAHIPELEPSVRACVPSDQIPFFDNFGGTRFDQVMIDAARHNLDGLVDILEREGVTVRRPSQVAWSNALSTPDWSCPSGLYAAMPRDVLLVVGNTIVEAPTAWRSRYFETHAYRDLLIAYFQQGANWIAAPKPRLCDSLFYNVPDMATYELQEHEPVFDAADFLRFGLDIVYQLSLVTNNLGVQWLRRQLGPTYSFHQVTFNDRKPMHIDATIMPLAEGRLLINPHRVIEIPEIFKEWEIIPAPVPARIGAHKLHFSSAWLSMNVLSLDEKTVVTEKSEESLRDLLIQRGFDVIPCEFREFYRFGGAFHCATVDIRRVGQVRAYF